MQFPTYGQNPWVQGAVPTQQQPQQQYPQQQQQQQWAQPSVFVPQPMAPAAVGGGMGGVPLGDGVDPFLSGMAQNVLRHQGQSYLQRGQAFMQSKMGFLSGGLIHYHFSVTPQYVRSKLAMLSAPFLRRWTYTRTPEQISGGHKYLPPRHDVNAPDLYIPVMALWTYCLLVGVALLSGKTFRPEVIYNTVSRTVGSWLVHTLLLKVLLYVLGVAGAVHFLELTALAGYAFVPACASLVAHLVLGRMGYHAVWAYGSLCSAVFLLRSMKRVTLQEATTYSIDATRRNYLLLGLAAFQFPFNAWLARLPA